MNKKHLQKFDKKRSSNSLGKLIQSSFNIELPKKEIKYDTIQHNNFLDILQILDNNNKIYLKN